MRCGRTHHRRRRWGDSSVGPFLRPFFFRPARPGGTFSFQRITRRPGSRRKKKRPSGLPPRVVFCSGVQNRTSHTHQGENLRGSTIYRSGVSRRGGRAELAREDGDTRTGLGQRRESERGASGARPGDKRRAKKRDEKKGPRAFTASRLSSRGTSFFKNSNGMT